MSEQMTFEQWLEQLDEYAESIGHGGDITASTGADCWHEYYNEGMSPRDAYLEDLSYGL